MQRLSALQQRLSGSGTSAVDKLNVRLRLAARALDSVSPLATLDRGYAVVSDDESGAILTDAAKVKPGSGIRAQLAHGTLQATVNKADTGTSDDS
jgi:exodeoxyribonuclease VII large subunit